MTAPDPAVLGKRVLVASRFLTMERHVLLGDGGRWSIREVVRHPGSVVAVPWTGSHVVLIEQYRHAAGRRLAELPAGKLDVEGEPPPETARRECIEEAGLDPARLTRLFGCFTSPGFTDEFSHIYLAEGLTPVDRDPQGLEEEQSSIIRLTPAEVADGLAGGAFEDATTIIGLQALLAHLR